MMIGAYTARNLGPHRRQGARNGRAKVKPGIGKLAIGSMRRMKASSIRSLRFVAKTARRSNISIRYSSCVASRLA
jgi:hypothetical protein